MSRYKICSGNGKRRREVGLILATGCPMFRRQRAHCIWNVPMKVRNSLKSLAGRHRANRLVRRNGRLYVINKLIRRFKARQG